ncbi:unnamed protein product [Paramecium sonneborni]|uniref:Uncharacterized protein n=1 Tax=Paramecium sonneborni TaxID=65129 RepID=A0A8S1PGC3_9CILI|nr:unnamed protein product [Paramecium sonneborni]
MYFISQRSHTYEKLKYSYHILGVKNEICLYEKVVSNRSLDNGMAVQQIKYLWGFQE